MKKKFLKFIMPLLIFIITGLVITFLVSYLDYKEIIKPLTSNIILYSSSAILFFLFSFYLGMKAKKRGLLIGITLLLIYFLFNVTFKGITSLFVLSNLLLFITKSLALIFGSVLGVNLSFKTN